MDLAGKFVDGFVLPVPKDNVEAYKAFSAQVGKVWMEHGALQYIECVGRDVPMGKLTSFPQAVKLEDGETVVFAWIVYENREHRDRVNAAVMSDPRLSRNKMENAPFDGKRMIFGGFEVLLSL